MRPRELMSLLAGAAVARSFGAHAPQKKVPVVGVLSGMNLFWTADFEDRGGKSGVVPHETVKFDYSMELGQYHRLPAMAADFVRRRVDVAGMRD